MNSDVHSNWIFGSSPNMTGGNNNSNMTEGNNALSIISQSGHIPPSVTLGRSETKTRGSRITNAYASAFRIAQSGRSMVEMLGMLAVIGVLSIGGIMGYSYGMDKYRANETINDIYLRAVMLTTALNQNTTLNSEEWPTTNSVGYPTSFLDDGIGNIGIRVQDVPSRVCKIVGDALSANTTVYVGNEDYVSLTADPCDASNNNIMEFYFSPTAECETDEDCLKGYSCDFGLCFNSKTGYVAHDFGTPCQTNADCNLGWNENCSVCQNKICTEYVFKSNKTCTFSDGTTGRCLSGECKKTSGCTYDTNKCGNKEFCVSPNKSSTDPFPNSETGYCVLINTVFRRIKSGDAMYYISNIPVNWWDADAGCKALNKQLVSLTDLSDDWDENDFKNNSKTNFTTSTFAQTLYNDVFGGKANPNNVWTSNNYNASNAYTINFADGNVRTRTHSTYAAFAICK